MKKAIAIRDLSPYVDMRQGSPQQAYEYAGKEESRVAGPWELGEPFQLNQNGAVVGQGKRSDLQATIQAIQAGATTSTIMTEHASTYVKYPRGIQALIAFKRRMDMPSWRNVSVLVLQGRTGTGKTRKALEVLRKQFLCLQLQIAKEHCDGDMPYILTSSNSKSVWWDGYEGQKAVILDEFYGSWMKYSVLLRVLDGHPFRLEVKGALRSEHL